MIKTLKIMWEDLKPGSGNWAVTLALIGVLLIQALIAFAILEGLVYLFGHTVTEVIVWLFFVVVVVGAWAWNAYERAQWRR